MKRISMIGLAVIALSIVPPAMAGGLTKTETNGRICHNEPCHIETFSGGYFFRGNTRPSQRGQTIKFFYKRVGRQIWHQFGRPGSERKVFISVDGTPSDRINRRHKWREHFDINGFTGFPHRRWILKAKFIRQDGMKASSEWVRVRAAYGD